VTYGGCTNSAVQPELQQQSKYTELFVIDTKQLTTASKVFQLVTNFGESWSLK